MLSPLCGAVQGWDSSLCIVLAPICGAFISSPLLSIPETVPGAVGHLSFTEILDTSLKVSWSEPGEKNGVLTGIQSPAGNRAV